MSRLPGGKQIITGLAALKVFDGQHKAAALNPSWYQATASARVSRPRPKSSAASQHECRRCTETGRVWHTRKAPTFKGLRCIVSAP